MAARTDSPTNTDSMEAQTVVLGGLTFPDLIEFVRLQFQSQPNKKGTYTNTLADKVLVEHDSKNLFYPPHITTKSSNNKSLFFRLSFRIMNGLEAMHCRYISCTSGPRGPNQSDSLLEPTCFNQRVDGWTANGEAEKGE